MADDLSPRRRLIELLAQGDASVDLAEAALTVAQEEYPLLETRPYLDQLNELGRRVRASIPGRKDPADAVAALNRVLFEEEGFTGNQEDYYDPRNSFFNEVMDRRTGIPITLCLLYMEVA